MYLAPKGKSVKVEDRFYTSRMLLPGTGAQRGLSNIRDISCPIRAKGGNFSGHHKHLIINKIIYAFEGRQLRFWTTALYYLVRNPFYPANTQKFLTWFKQLPPGGGISNLH
jgi:hypothetical protein